MPNHFTPDWLGEEEEGEYSWYGDDTVSTTYNSHHLAQVTFNYCPSHHNLIDGYCESSDIGTDSYFQCSDESPSVYYSDSWSDSGVAECRVRSAIGGQPSAISSDRSSAIAAGSALRKDKK